MTELSKESANPRIYQRYPKLYETIFKITSNLIQKSYNECCELVEELLKMELGFINTSDPEFEKEVYSAITNRGFLELKNPKLEDSNWFSGFWQRKDDNRKDYGVFQLTAQEDAHCEVLETILSFYFNIVRK